MTSEIIEVRCPNCGRVEIEAQEIRLCVEMSKRAGWQPTSTRAFYGLACPECDEYFTREADAFTAELLMRAHVWIFSWYPSAEFVEPRPEGPPLRLDDLIDLHFELEGMFA